MLSASRPSHPDGPVATPAAALALEALRCFRARQTEDGAALYRRVFEAPGGWDQPVRLHARLLAGTGLTEAADIVLRIGLHAGADLSSGRLARNEDPEAAAAEYEDLWTRGITNARMFADYLVALSRAGDAARLASAAAPDLLFRRITLRGHGDDAWLSRLTAAVLGARSRQFQAKDKSIRNLERVNKTHALDDPDLTTLHAIVRDRIQLYMADVRAVGHAIAPWLRTDFELRSWGVISEDAAGGYNAPHIHTGCWVVAVAYLAGDDPAASDNGSAGSLRIGRPEGAPACAGWPDITVAPIPGTLVIMPAYYTHWTEPLRGPGLRVSVAFNAEQPWATRALPIDLQR